MSLSSQERQFQRDREFSRKKDLLSRKINKKNYYRKFAQWFLLWLRGVIQLAKDEHLEPLLPTSVLPSYYTDKWDKEVAAFAALQIQARDVSRAINGVSELREMIGEHPWEWFVNRKFISFSVDNTNFSVVSAYKVAKMFSYLWDICHLQTNDGKKDLSIVCPIGVAVSRKAYDEQVTYMDALKDMLGDSVAHSYGDRRLRILLLSLCLRADFSVGIWESDNAGLKCPLLPEAKFFADQFIPDYSDYGDLDDGIDIMGLSISDFLYAAWGWKYLCKRNPSECKRLQHMYTSFYKKGYCTPKTFWTPILFGL